MDDLIPLLLATAQNFTVSSAALAARALTLAAPLRQYVLSVEQNPPELTTVVLLLVIIYLSLAILRMATQWVWSMVMFVVRLVVVAVVAGLGMWIYRDGVDEVGARIGEWVGERGWL